MLFKNLSGACLLLASLAFGATLGSPSESHVEALDQSLRVRGEIAGRAPDKCEDGKHQTKCTYDAKGNSRMGFADKKINYGNVSMAHLFKTIRNHCKPVSGCIDPTWTIPTKIIRDDHYYYGVVKVKTIVNTAYTPAQYKGLVDVAEAAMRSIVKVDYRNYHDCEGIPFCEDPPYIKHKPQWIAPSTFYVRKPETKKEDAQFIGFTTSVEIDAADEGGGVCTTFATIASAVSGAWSGVAGGVFTLLGLLCE